MNSYEKEFYSLVLSIGTAIGIVLIGILLFNLPEIINIISTEGLISE